MRNTVQYNTRQINCLQFSIIVTDLLSAICQLHGNQA